MANSTVNGDVTNGSVTHAPLRADNEQLNLPWWASALPASYRLKAEGDTQTMQEAVAALKSALAVLEQAIEEQTASMAGDYLLYKHLNVLGQGLRKNARCVAGVRGGIVLGILPMDASILPPTDDRIFKLIFTAPKTEPALMDLISSIINRKVVGVQVRNNELPVDNNEDKNERFDVNCTIDDGTQIDLEMQASRIQEDEEEDNEEYNNLKGKTVYYLCDLHSSQPSKGKRYDKLAQTWQITICSYTVLPNNGNYVNSYTLRNDRDGTILTNAIHVVFVELTKLGEILKKPVSEMTDLEQWALFFKYASNPKYREKVNEIIDSKEAIQMAGTLLIEVSQDERERARLRSRRMYQSDYDSDMITSFDNGVAKGKAEGRAEGKVEMIRSFLAQGVPIEIVAKASGKSLDYIQSLQQNLSM